MTLRRYERYKDSGVEWLGAVPEHWDVRPLKHVADFRSGGTPDKGNLDYWDGTVPWASAKDLKADELFDTTDHITSEALAAGAASILPANSVLVVVRGMILARAFPVACARVPMAINQDLKAVIPRASIDVEYLAWLLRGSEQETLSRLDEAGHGTKALRMDAWAALPVPVPPLDEQRCIASFIGREAAKIDTLVAEQQQLIELLTEKHQAVIAHAVTKGLNPSAPMKDSGVEWLGKVPTHWEVPRLGRFATVRSGYAFPSAGFSMDDTDTRLLRGVNVGVGALRWDEAVYWKRQPDDGLDAFALSAGDVVLGMDRPFVGDGTRVARVSAPDLPCLLLQRVASIHPSPGLLSGYLIELLRSSLFVHHIGPETTGVSVPHISPGQVCDFRVPVPPVNEQLGIVRMIEETVGKTEALISDASTAVTLLFERRSALISAAVTGQIEVANSASVESALAETDADIAAGRYVVESAAAHVARVQAMAAADEHPASPPRSC